MTRAEAMREVAAKMRDVARRLPDDPRCAAEFVGWAVRLDGAAAQAAREFNAAGAAILRERYHTPTRPRLTLVQSIEPDRPVA